VVFLVKFLHFFDSSKQCRPLFSIVLTNSSGLSIPKTQLVLFVLLAEGGSFSTTEEVLEFLLGEVNVIVTMGVRVFCGVVAVVLPERV